jgi:hypothetical protein
MRTPEIFPVTGIWIVWDVAAVTDNTTERFQDMLARKMLHHFLIDKLFLYGHTPPPEKNTLNPLPGALRVRRNRAASPKQIDKAINLREFFFQKFAPSFFPRKITRADPASQAEKA